MSCLTPEVWAAQKLATGTCYKVLMWVDGAIPEAVLTAWSQERSELLAQMHDAGIKGSRGKLATLEKALSALNECTIESRLTQCTCASFSRTRAEKLTECLRSEDTVLAYRTGSASVCVLAELTGQEGVDSMIARWQASTPGLEWCNSSIIEALSPASATAWQESCRRVSGTTTATEEVAQRATPNFHHVTVLLDETISALQPSEGKIFIDATLGGGGHTERLLAAGAEVWGIDQDPTARAAARDRLYQYGNRLHILAGNFRNAADLLQQQGIGAVDGLLADIGISSPQVDCADRGFSFMSEGPLDMRMNPSTPRSAADIVNNAAESELSDILWQYGEERASRAIARRIIKEREKAPITSTTQLANLISCVLPRKGKQHPATRSFQALRIAVNDELGALNSLLENGLSLLKSGGRFAVITFHSLEDRAVKHYFDLVTRPEIDRPEWPAPRPNPAYAARLLFRKPIVPSEEEISTNPRSRSAKLRIIEKL